MKVTTASKLRQNLSKCMDEVADDHAPMLITRANGKHAVLMSLEDFAGYEETRYLNANPANAKRLDEAMADAEAGRNMIDVEFDEAKGEYVRKQPAPTQDAASGKHAA